MGAGRLKDLAGAKDSHNPSELERLVGSLLPTSPVKDDLNSQWIQLTAEAHFPSLTVLFYKMHQGEVGGLEEWGGDTLACRDPGGCCGHHS